HTPGNGVIEDSVRVFSISNGKKKVEITYNVISDPELEFDAFVDSKRVEKLSEIFSKTETPFFNNKCLVGKSYTFKEIEINVDYYVVNKAEIDQFNENNYPHGVEKVGKRDPEKGHYLGGALTCSGGDNRGNEYTIAAFEKHPVGFDPDCYGQNGNLISPIKGKSSDNQKPDPISGQNSNPPQSSGLSKSVKEQVVNYMKQNGIFQLTLDNGKIVVEYNNSSKKEEKEINSQQLKTIQDYLKSHNNSVNYEQLNYDANSPTTDLDKKPDYIY
ncbi:6158_t:CDS:2, partial [Funneliformis geosporum]